MLTTEPSASTTAELVQPNGAIQSSTGADLCVVDEHNFIYSDYVYGPAGQSILDSANAVLVIPRKALTSGPYTVRIFQPGKTTIERSFVVI